MTSSFCLYPYCLTSEGWLNTAPLDDTVMTKRNDCDHCGQRDMCSGICLLASEMTRDEVRRDY